MKKSFILVMSFAALNLFAAQEAVEVKAEAKAEAKVEAKKIVNESKTPTEAVNSFFKYMKEGNLDALIAYSTGSVQAKFKISKRYIEAKDMNEVKDIMLEFFKFQKMPKETYDAMALQIETKIKTMTDDEKKEVVGSLRENAKNAFAAFKNVTIEITGEKIDGDTAEVSFLMKSEDKSMPNSTFLVKQDGIWFNADKNDYPAKAEEPAK